MTNEKDTRVAVEIPCGGGCGATIKLPPGYASEVEAGKASAPLCMQCLDKIRGGVRKVRQVHSAPVRKGKAKGPAPEHTTLTIKRISDQGSRHHRYSFELHPCKADDDVPRWKLLNGFGKAMADRVRMEAMHSLGKGRAVIERARQIVMGKRKP
jgi:hypothetical protein